MLSIITLPTVITLGNKRAEGDCMKKGITKEQVIDVALNLMREKEDIRSVNLREIARVLGCAHTNLYNYFGSFDDLLWEAHVALLQKASDSVKEKISQTDDEELKLQYFFFEFVDFYLNNKGWFRLAWVEIIGGKRPKSNEIATVQAVDTFVDSLITIWKNLYELEPQKEKMKYALHNVHCYIYGEVSIYIARRSLIPEESEFKKYVVKEAVKMMKLLLNSKE